MGGGSQLEKTLLLGYDFTSASAQQLATQIVRNVESGYRQSTFACANPHSLEVARKDPEFAAALSQVDFLVPDGIGIILAAHVLDVSLHRRVTGWDIFYETMTALNAKGAGKVFFLGASVRTLELVEQRVAVDFPHLHLVGAHSPPYKKEFTDEENQGMIGKVNRAKPDLLWVGMTAPKQEKWIFRNLEHLHVGFAGPIGAVFDFYAGTARRSHPIYQSLGLEWLPRFFREPRRLWRRNLVSNPRFMLRVLKERMGLQVNS